MGGPTALELIRYKRPESSALELFQKKELTTREGGPAALELIRYKEESSALELFQKKEPTTREGDPLL